MRCRFSLFLLFNLGVVSAAFASTSVPLTVNFAEAVAVTGTPRIAIDVGGQTRYATYSAGSGTNTLTFTLSPQAGDVDQDGIAVTSPLDLNGGTIKDLAGNPLSPLTFTPPTTTGIKVDYPSLGMDFTTDADGRYSLNGTAYNDLPSFLTAASGSFTRASAATYFDSTGTLQTATSNTPRFDYDPVTHAAKGLLIEESRTNYIRNSTLQGGSAGVFPSNWSCGSFDGITASVVSVGTELGMPYLDLRINGTASASPTNTNLALFFESTTQITASSGQSWVMSVPFTLQAGVGQGLKLQIEERNATGTLLASSIAGPVVPSSGSLAANRLTLQRTLNNASTARASGSLRFYYTANQSVDMTVRVGIPQFEQGSFATSYIRTTNATVTRAADTLTLPTGTWYNANTGSLFAQASTLDADTTHQPTLASFDDGTANNRLQFRKAGLGLPNLRLVVGGTSLADVNGSTSWSTSVVYKYAGGYQSANNKIYMGGTFQTSYLTASALPTATQMQVGGGPVSSALNGYVEKLKYYPARLADTALQTLTQ